MAPTPRPWTALPHGALERHEQNLWSVEAPVPGLPLRRRMALVRLRDGRVVIHSAIALEEPAMSAIEAWGTPAVLLVPNAFHRLDAHAYKARYPKVTVLCPAPADRAVRERVAVDGHYDAFPSDDSVRLEALDGTRSGEAALVVRSGPALERASLVFTDAVFNHEHVAGALGLFLRLIGSTGGPRVTKLFRLAAVRDRAALRAHLARLAETPGLERVLVGHGSNIEREAAATLRALAARA
jgi:hypothetical protein